MTEAEAWETLQYYSTKGGVRIERQMTINVLRRTLAKVYQPRKATDDDRQMREINSCIDEIELARDRRELSGEPEPVAAATMARAEQPWQTDPSEPCTIYRTDFTDSNYIKKSIYERAVRFGKVELYRAWGWDGERFRKVIAVFGNDFTLEELGRALLYSQVNGSNPVPCEAVFVTTGEGRPRRFRLTMVRMGRSCEDVSRYERYFDCEPNDPYLQQELNTWLDQVRDELALDRCHY